MPPSSMYFYSMKRKKNIRKRETSLDRGGERFFKLVYILYGARVIRNDDRCNDPSTYAHPNDKLTTSRALYL